MGVYSVLRHKMKCFVVLSAVVACGFAAPVAEADADAGLIAGTYGHGLLGHGLVGGVYAAGHAVAAPAVATVAHAAPAVATYAAATPAVATVAHAAPAVATYGAAAPVAVAHPAPVAVATAPVVHHVPQVSVQRHTSTHSTHHVINHAPVVGAAIAHHAVATPAVAGVVAV